MSYDAQIEGVSHLTHQTVKLLLLPVLGHFTYIQHVYKAVIRYLAE